MSIIYLLIVLILFGGLLYLVTLLPIDQTIKRIIEVIAIIGIVVWFLLRIAQGFPGGLRVP